jgi:LacI family transcriptional regulator
MVTLKEIAKKAGISPSTVSRVLSYDPTLSVADATRTAVFEIAEALNYASPRTRAMRRAGNGKRLRIALAHFLRPEEELADPYYVAVRLGIERHCQALQAEIVRVYHTDDAPDASLLASASGVIAVGPHTEEEIGWLAKHSEALVFADSHPSGERFDCTFSDLASATTRLLDLLFSNGYKKFGIIAGFGLEDDKSAPKGDERCRAFRAWAEKHQVFDPGFLHIGTLRHETGYTVMQRWLGNSGIPQVIIGGNDNVAIGVYRAAQEGGLKVGKDFAVVGFNDIPAAQFLSPPLTTIHLEAEKIGEAAVDLLLERLAGRDTVKEVKLGAKIIWRDSCRNTKLQPHKRAGSK